MSTLRWSQSIADQVAAAAQPGVVADSVCGVRRRIEEREDELRAWVTFTDDLDDQAARIEGDASAQALRGISVGVKDLIDVAGLPTRAGSSVTSAAPADTDADCVARLRSLGAVIQGKTVTTEFGYFAPGPTRNPHALGHTPGGSSSGSAAAVGAGVLPAALGTQTAGSLTRPASYCGAAGMVLAHGTTSTAGIVGLSQSLDSLGLLTRSVRDLKTFYTAFTGAEQLAASGNARVFVWHGSALDDIAAEMGALLARIPALCKDIGADARPLDWDDHVHTLADDHAVVMAHEAARTRREELRRTADLLSAPLRLLLEHGAQIAAADVHAALARRDRLLDLLAATLGDAGLIIGPAALGSAPAGLTATGSPVLSRPWQLLGLPVVVVPGAVSTSGLPLGLQIVGLPGREHDMLDLGEALEAALRAGATVPDESGALLS